MAEPYGKKQADQIKALLDMECDWPVFDANPSGTMPSYQVTRVKVKDLALLN
jgi:hypothetical protein